MLLMPALNATAPVLADPLLPVLVVLPPLLQAEITSAAIAPAAVAAMVLRLFIP